VKASLRSIFASLLCILALLFGSTGAVAMTVQPVVLNLTVGGRSMSQVVTVTNSFTYPLAVELRAEELVLDASGVRSTGKETGDLLIFPPQAMIQPGQTQSFRVQFVGDPQLARSKHYYVTVAQLPVQLQQGQSAVQVLYNFQVLVSVSPAGAKPSIRVDRAEIQRTENGRPVPVVTVTNNAAAHGYLSNGRIRILQKDASGKEVFRRTLSAPEVQQAIGFGLVGAGQTRRVTLPVELPSEAGSVEAEFTAED
jgi:fimbrial chaperone protein